MASLTQEIVVKKEYRPCMIDGKKALFHKWSDEAEIVPPSNLIGGHAGGVIKATFGLIEYEDGTIHKAYPEEIVFCDNKLKEMEREIDLFNCEVIE